MQDVCVVDDLGSPDNTILNNQVLSNLSITLWDPLHIPSKGMAKALRLKLWDKSIQEKNNWRRRESARFAKKRAM